MSQNWNVKPTVQFSRPGSLNKHVIPLYRTVLHYSWEAEEFKISHISFQIPCVSAESLRYFYHHIFFTVECGFDHRHFTIVKMAQINPSTHAAVHGRLDAFCPKDWNQNVECGLNQPCYKEPSKKWRVRRTDTNLVFTQVPCVRHLTLLPF